MRSAAFGSGAAICRDVVPCCGGPSAGRVDERLGYKRAPGDARGCARITLPLVLHSAQIPSEPSGLGRGGWRDTHPRQHREVNTSAGFVARESALGGLGEFGEDARGWTADRVVERSGAAFGALGTLVAETAMTDVFVNPDGSVWCDRGRGAACERGIRIPADEARELAVRLIALGGRHVDEATPCVDVRLGDGVRVHVVLPPVATGGPAISIRLQRRVPITLDELLADSILFHRPGRSGSAAGA
jgi:hypothetical protein